LQAHITTCTTSWKDLILVVMNVRLLLIVVLTQNVDHQTVGIEVDLVT